MKMSRVITFSRTFPGYHPRAGEPTYFVEKILRGIHDDEHLCQLYKNEEILRSLNFYEVLNLESIGKFDPKHHTIRAGHRWKVGDWFSPRVWSGKPYNSKQIQFAPDLQIKKIWDFEVNRGTAISDDDIIFFVNNYIPSVALYEEVAKNDGLSLDDLYTWFQKPMLGQIICWNESINY